MRFIKSRKIYVQKLALTVGIFSSFFTTQTALAVHSCEVNFVKYVNGEIPADLAKNPMANMWDERFSVDAIMAVLKKSTKKEASAYVEELSKLVYKDAMFNKNLTTLVNRAHRKGFFSKSSMDKSFLNKKFEHSRFYYDAKTKAMSFQPIVDTEKYNYIKKNNERKQNIGFI